VPSAPNAINNQQCEKYSKRVIEIISHSIGLWSKCVGSVESGELLEVYDRKTTIFSIYELLYKSSESMKLHEQKVIENNQLKDSYT